MTTTQIYAVGLAVQALFGLRAVQYYRVNPKG